MTANFKKSVYLTLVLVFAMFLVRCDSLAADTEDTIKFDLSSLDKRVWISDLLFSPDGQFLFFSVERGNVEANHWDKAFFIMDIRKQQQQPFEFKQRGVHSFKFSPCGKYLSFVATAEISGVSRGQVHIMRFPGGDAKCVTAAPRGVRQYAWSPDSEAIAYLTTDAAPEKPVSEKHLTGFEVGNNNYLATSTPQPAHLWLVRVSGGKARRLTEGPKTILSGPQWSPDGKSVAFTRGVSPYRGDSRKRKLEMLRLSDGTITAVTGNPAECFPSFSPGVSSPPLLSYFYPRKGNPAAMYDVYILPVKRKSAPQNLTAGLDINVSSSQWLPGGKSLLITAPLGTRMGMWRVPVKGKPVRVNLGNITGVSDVTVSRKKSLAFVGITADRPEELFYMESLDSAPIRLTNFHASIAGLNLGKTETIEWQGEDGMNADGILTYPPGFSKGKTYPLVLVIHGGPTSFSNENFSSIAQLFAAQGWVVFNPNYRGSCHRGNDFQTAIMNDAAQGPGKDIMAGIEAVKKRGFVDENRIAVSGWSYGGFLTAWLIGRYPNVWKAAMAGAAAVDITDMTCLSNMNAMIRHAITSSPWKGDNFKDYLDQSPIKYLSRIRTPTLIMSKTGDGVVSVTGSYKLYHALKANDVPVQFIAYPGGGHFPGDPANSRDTTKRWLGWLAKFLN